MRLHARMALLMVLLVLLPALPAAWMARQLVSRSLNLGLSDEVDLALDAGVRQARDVYQRQRKDLADSLEAWISSLKTSTLRDGQYGSEDVTRAVSDPLRPRLPGDFAELRMPDGETVILRQNPPRAKEDVARPATGRAAADVRRAASPGARAASPDAPPGSYSVSVTLRDGGVLEVGRATPEVWRNDAHSLAAALQALRGIRMERDQIEHGFWLPFVGIYAISLLAAVAAASWLARGIILRLTRLLEATRAIGAGRWDVRVPVSGRDEIARLSEQFNDMVRRLDAQSRRLVDLETMAGWREMARALAHEVKNPLTPIQLTVEEMRERYRGDDREYAGLLQECSRMVVQEVESLRNVVTRFREFSRPVEPKFASIDLNSLVRDIGALQRDLQVELDLAADLGVIRADEDRLRQMMMNLARNAQAATASRESPRLRLATRAAGDAVVLVVEDNGPGIPESERDRIFEPYRSGSKGGLGLGLALVKGIILAHGGSIRVDSGTSGGARFQIELPRDPEAADG